MNSETLKRIREMKAELEKRVSPETIVIAELIRNADISEA